MKTLYGLLIGAGVGLGISLLIGLVSCGQEAVALVTCSNDRPLSEMNMITIIFIMIICTAIGGIIGFAMDMSCLSYNKRIKREKAEKEKREAQVIAEKNRLAQIEMMKQKEEEDRRAFISRFQTILNNAYKTSYTTNDLDAGNYKYVEQYLINNSNSKWIKEAKNLFNDYRRKHIDEYRGCLKNGGINNLIVATNHLMHFSNMTNGDFSENAINLKNIVNMLNNKSLFIDNVEYGKVLTNTFDPCNEQVSVNDESMVRIENTYSTIIGFNGVQEIKFFNPDFIKELVRELYSLAFSKPFNSDKYKKIYNIYNQFTYQIYDDKKERENSIHIIPSIDGIFSKIVAYSRMGKGVLKQIKGEIDIWVDANLELCNQNVVVLASGLMFIGEYEMELELLRCAASNGVQLTSNIQERLAFLESGGSSGPELFNNTPKNVFNYDYSALKWSDTDFSNFFKNLAFRNNNIEYALVVSEFKKSFKAKFKGTLSYNMILESLKQMARNEYLDDISCELIKVNSLSEDIYEDDEAIIIKVINDVNVSHAAIFVFYNKIGININVQILTIFVPNQKVDIQKNMKLAISLKQETSPKVTQIMESIRDSVARQIDDLCERNFNDNNSSIY